MYLILDELASLLRFLDRLKIIPHHETARKDHNRYPTETALDQSLLSSQMRLDEHERRNFNRKAE